MDDFPISDSDVLCGCANMTYAMYRTLLQSRPDISFDEVLRRANAGDTCTACLLDLEYHFADILARRPKSKTEGTVSGGAMGNTPESFKRRIYRFADGIAPVVPVRKVTQTPVLIGKNIEQWLWIANQRLLYGETDVRHAPAPLRAAIVLRNETGHKCVELNEQIDVGEVLNLNLSERLRTKGVQPGPTGLGLGSVEIVVEATEPGMWGTTRPQIEILTPSSACAVHTSGAGANVRNDFTCLYRPVEDRLFAAIVNPCAHAITLWSTYDVHESAESAAGALDDGVKIPAHGTWLKEITLPAQHHELATGRLVDLGWRMSDRHKLHMICASPNLDRFSIDHL